MEIDIGVIEWVSFVTGIVSICLGGIAFGASLYFYDKARSTEVRVTGLLAEISAQTRTLQEIAAGQTQQLLKTVSNIAEKHFEIDPDFGIGKITAALKEIRDTQAKDKPSETDEIGTNVIKDHGIPNLVDPLTLEVLQSEAIGFLSITYLYAGAANKYAQNVLPGRKSFNPQEQHHLETAAFLDASAKDFFAARQSLLGLETSLPERTKLVPHFARVVSVDTELKNAVRTTEETHQFQDFIEILAQRYTTAPQQPS